MYIASVSPSVSIGWLEMCDINKRFLKAYQ